MTEFIDPEEVLCGKYTELFELLGRSKNVVFFTGAGISTAANIPDFRGDKGVDKSPLNIAQIGASERDLDSKMPTFGHRAISVLLERDSRFKFLATSNHDGLHQKSGTPWEKSANIFGTAYIEECLVCRTQYTRKVIVPALHRKCDNTDCNGKMKKTGVRYGQTVPVGPLRLAEEAAKAADLVLVLGSSMTTSPFCDLPSLSDNYVICNRQTTPFDKGAKICIHDNVDNFMTRLLHETLPNANLDLEYRQEFVIKELDSSIIITTPQHNEPAVFIDTAIARNSAGNSRSFECSLLGVFSLPRESVEDGSEVEIEFKEGFEVENVKVVFKAGEVNCGALVKHLQF